MSKVTIPGMKPSLGSVTKRSQEIFNIFTRTQQQAEKVNQEIAVLTHQKQAEVDRINADIKQLQEVSAKNTALSDKIAAFLNS